MITIVGHGEIGRVVERCAVAANEEVRVVRRGEDPAASVLASGPIVACVREGDLAAVAASLASVASRAVFVQNGWIEDVLRESLGASSRAAPAFAGSSGSTERSGSRGSRSEVTRGLLWFTAKGELFEVLAPSIFYGPCAVEMARVFEAGGVAARAVSERAAFVREMGVKLAWNNVVGLPLAVRGMALGEYLAAHAEEARAIVEETCAAVAAETGVGIDARAAFSVLIETTGKLASVRGGKKALEFRNGAVVRLARAQGRAAPVNSRLLASV